MPSVRYGRAHIYHNYYNCAGNLYCIRSHIQAECFIENNYFDSVNDPYYICVRDPAEIIGKVRVAGNFFYNCTRRIDDGDDDVFVSPCSYTLDKVLDVLIVVRMDAGVDGVDFFPHWLFGLYGDFDRNGSVDMAGLSQFADYWLVNEIADTGTF